MSRPTSSSKLGRDTSKGGNVDEASLSENGRGNAIGDLGKAFL